MNIDAMIEIIVLIFVLTGTLMSLLSSFGLIRLPDVYTRSHAGTKSTTIGLLSILFGGFLYFWLAKDIVSIRLLLAIIFVFVTAPVAGHLIARSAYRYGVSLADMSIKDELKDYYESQHTQSQEQIEAVVAKQQIETEPAAKVMMEDGEAVKTTKQGKRGNG